MESTHVQESTADDTSSHWVKHCQTELYVVQALHIGSHVNKMARVHIQKNIFHKFQISHDISNQKWLPSPFITIFYYLNASWIFPSALASWIIFTDHRSFRPKTYRPTAWVDPVTTMHPTQKAESTQAHTSQSPMTRHDIDKAFVSFYSLVWRFVLNVYADDHFN